LLLTIAVAIAKDILRLFAEEEKRSAGQLAEKLKELRAPAYHIIKTRRPGRTPSWPTGR
jgi:hypothetical protein